jgi:phage terminase large subunit-like protein
MPQNGTATHHADSITKDWIQTASDEIAVNKHGCYFDIDAAERVRGFLRDWCKHSKGEFAGQPFELLEWQWKDFVAPTFGWMMPDGTRRIRNVEAFLPKKNGKSTLCAGIALYMLTFDYEAAAEVYLAAYDRKQAGIVYNESRLMVEKSDALYAALDIRRSTKEIRYDDNGSFLIALSKESKSSEGINIHALIFDELHTQRDRQLWAALRYGGASRRQPLLVSISTAGELDETSLWWEVFQHAIKVKDGSLIDIHTWPCVYYTKPTDDWHSEDTWRAANPSYDTTINKVQFRQDYEKATQSGPNESEFKRYRLNLATRHESTWIQNHYWTGCTFKKPEDMDMEPCELIVAGLDLADSTDLNALALIARKEREKKYNKRGRLIEEPDKPAYVKYITKPMFWAPSEAGISQNQGNRDRYLQYFETGLVKQIAGPIARQDIILLDIVNTLLQYQAEGLEVAEIAADRFQATDFAYRLQAKMKEKGLRTKMRLVGYNYISMNEPTKKLEEIIHGGLLVHDDNPVMRWMFGNALCMIDSNGNRKLDKSGSKGKIDGFAALCLGMRAFMEIDAEKKTSRFNTPGAQLATREGYHA